LQDVRANHRRGDVAEAEQFLHSADVTSSLEKVRGEGVSTVSHCAFRFGA
jgi:hypothetical protein